MSPTTIFSVVTIDLYHVRPKKKRRDIVVNGHYSYRIGDRHDRGGRGWVANTFIVNEDSFPFWQPRTSRKIFGDEQNKAPLTMTPLTSTRPRPGPLHTRPLKNIPTSRVGLRVDPTHTPTAEVATSRPKSPFPTDT